MRGDIRRKWNVYTSRAKQRRQRFTLSFFEFMFFVSGACVYCGTKDNIGLDRVVNDSGYTSDNVVPCCEMCNSFKSNRDLGAFLIHCKRIAKNHDSTRRLIKKFRKRKTGSVLFQPSTRSVLIGIRQNFSFAPSYGEGRGSHRRRHSFFALPKTQWYDDSAPYSGMGT